MSSPTRPSAFRSRPKAAATPGRRTAARTSSRPGRTIRSATRPAKRFMCATKRAAICGRRRRCRSATKRRPTSRATATATAASSIVAHGIALELLQFVPLADPDQDLAAHHPQHLGPGAPAVGHRLCRMGARPVARRIGAVDRHGARRGDWRDVRAQSLEHVAWHASPSPIWAAGRPPGRPTAPNSSAATARLDNPAALERRHSPVARVGAGLDPCAALQTSSSSPRRRDRNRLLPRPSRRCRRGAGADRALPRRRSRRRPSRSHRPLGRPARHACR